MGRINAPDDINGNTRAPRLPSGSLGIYIVATMAQIPIRSRAREVIVDWLITDRFSMMNYLLFVVFTHCNTIWPITERVEQSFSVMKPVSCCMSNDFNSSSMFNLRVATQ